MSKLIAACGLLLIVFVAYAATAIPADDDKPSVVVSFHPQFAEVIGDAGPQDSAVADAGSPDTAQSDTAQPDTWEAVCGNGLVEAGVVAGLKGLRPSAG